MIPVTITAFIAYTLNQNQALFAPTDGVKAASRLTTQGEHQYNGEEVEIKRTQWQVGEKGLKQDRSG